MITAAVAREALELMEIDGEGLEGTDRELLRAIAFKFDGGPVGLSTLAVTLGEETDTIEDVYEPYLLQLGFLQRTPRGRVITKLGRAHVGAPAAPEPRLFDGVIRRAAAVVVAVLASAGCGGSGRLTADGLASCLADRGVESAPRGDDDAATEVLAFDVPGTPPARGLLIVVDDAEYAETLERDIRGAAQEQGSVAHTVRERNVIAHFLTARPPTEREQAPIRACLEE